MQCHNRYCREFSPDCTRKGCSRRLVEKPSRKQACGRCGRHVSIDAMDQFGRCLTCVNTLAKLEREYKAKIENIKARMEFNP